MTYVTQGHTDCDIMADDELLVTMQVKENAFIFNELEHETFEDLEHTVRRTQHYELNLVS